MDADLQAAADSLKSDMAIIKTGVATALQRIADLTAQLQGPTPPDNSAVIAELQGIHADAVGVIGTLPADTTTPPAGSGA